MIVPLGNGVEAEVIEPERGMFPTSLGGAVEFTVVHFVYKVLELMGGGLGVFFGSSLVWFLHTVEPELVEYARPIISEMLSNKNIPPWFANMLRNIQRGEHEIDGVFAGNIIGSTTSSSVMSFFEPLFLALNMAAWVTMPIKEPDVDTLIALMWRGIYSPGEAKDRMVLQGYRDDLADGFEEIARPRMAAYDLIRWMFRHLLEDGGVNDELAKRGYTPADIEKMVEFARPLTSPDDLQDMMFRRIIGEDGLGDRLKKHGFTDAQIAEFLAYAWHLLPVADIIELWKREQKDDAWAIERLRHHGFDRGAATEILSIARPLIGVDDLVRLYWLSQPDGFPIEERLKKHGFTDGQIGEIKQLAERIPPPPDLVSMAVREAWDEQFISTYGYMARFPKEFAEWMQKQGYSEDWAKKYWVAHWKLPSVQHAFEMLHREQITEEDLRALLIAADIAPVWHEPIIQTAYHPLTRVDVRRMYGLGILDEGQVFKAYKDLGYNDTNAQYMTEFTIKYSASGERDLTKTDILQAYRAGVIEAGDARDALIAIGYSPTAIVYMLAYEEWKKEQDLLDDEVALLQKRYVNGQIDRSDVYTALGTWNLPDRQVRLYLDKWDITKEGEESLATASQLEAFVKAGIIGRGEYREQMEKRHYSRVTAGWFLQEIDHQIAEAAQKEEERALREKERVEAATEKSDYEITRADFDLQIAQLKTALAENFVLLPTLTDVTEIENIYKQNEQIQLSIVRLREQKAQAKLEHTRTLRGFIE